MQHQARASTGATRARSIRPAPARRARDYSRAYLRHLFVSGEILAARLHTIHNLTYYLGLMRRMREAIAASAFAPFRVAFLAGPEAAPSVEEVDD